MTSATSDPSLVQHPEYQALLAKQAERGKRHPNAVRSGVEGRRCEFEKERLLEDLAAEKAGKPRPSIARRARAKAELDAQKYGFGSAHDFAHAVTGKALRSLPPAARVSCGFCNAPAGQRCRTVIGGEPVTYFHTMREKAAGVRG